ncbi:MAG: flagellar biosynthesis anti-sigma factor FlgM [Desulfobacterales bacterium]|nr:flagellar biosynthesis anti-sigma factor FlgM [Desulfobacterales bacterium]
MKINDQSAHINFEAHTQRALDAAHQAEGNARNENAPPSADKVVLSPKARELQDARVELAGLPDIDTQRVAQIQHQIEKGTYRIDGGQIAERMLAEMRLHSGL